MEITFYSQGHKLLSVTPDDNSYRYRKISGEDRVTLSFTAPRLLSLPVGLVMSFQGARYTMLAPATITKLNSRAWHYDLQLDAPAEELRKWRMKHRTDGAVKFNLTARPEEHLRMLVDVANAANPDQGDKWQIESCVDHPEKLISYDHTDLLSALSLIAKTFDTEWIARGKRITLGKVEANKDAPLALSYGKGNGLRSGLKRENASQHTRITRLYVQGSDRNIYSSSYGARTLHLPKEMSVSFDGDRFEGEQGFAPDRAHRYSTSKDGAFVERTDDQDATGAEGSLDATEIYPSRVGVVANWSVVAGETKDKHPLYAFTDPTIPDGLDFAKSVIPGQPLTVVFQTGMLAGQSFEAQYTHRDRRFVLIGKEIDGVWMPAPPFVGKSGDKYAVYHVKLPQAYIRNDNDKSGAEWELLRKSLKHLYEAGLHPYTYRADVDGLWLKADWINRGGKVVLGGYVRLSDPELIPDGVDIRIAGIKDYLVSPETPELELATSAVGSSILTKLDKLKQDDAKQAEDVKRLGQETARSMQQALETASQIARATAERLGREVSASAVRTMQLLAGDPAVQLRILEPDNWLPVWQSEGKTLHLPYALIEHMTLGLPEGTLSPDKSARRQWEADDYTSAPLTDARESYYVYVTCPIPEGARDAYYKLSFHPLPLEDGDQYNLLLGLLSSEDDKGGRSFAPLYGWSEILPGRITTDRLVSADGKTSIDLRTGAITSPKISFVYPDGSRHPYPNDYLHKAITDGSAEIQGGLVLGTLIGAKDERGKIRSFISGRSGYPALASGVAGLEEGNPTYKTAINHNGEADFGSFHIRHPYAGGFGSLLALDNHLYTAGNKSLNPYSVVVGGEHQDIKRILRDSLTSTETPALREVMLKNFEVRFVEEEDFEGRPSGYSIPPTDQRETIVIPANELGGIIRGGSRLDVELTIRANLDSTSAGNLRCGVQVIYGSNYQATSSVDVSVVSQRVSFTTQANPDGSLGFGLVISGEGFSGGLLTLLPRVKVTSEPLHSRGVYLTQAGLMVFYDKSTYLNIDYSRLPYVDALSGAIRNADRKFIDVAGSVRIKGETDMPGVLFAGRVSANPVSFANRWGAMEISVSRPSGWGRYVFNHKLRHTNYVVQATAIGSDGAYAVVTEQTDTSFTVVTYHRGAPTDDFSFSVLVVGDN